MIRFLFLTLFSFGCTPNTLTPGTPQAADVQSSFRTDIESGIIEVVGLEEISDVDIDALAMTYDDFVADGIIADSSELARAGGNACSNASRGDLVSLKLKAIYSKNGVAQKYDGSFLGLAALGYIVPDEPIDAENFEHLWEVTYCSVDFNGQLVVASGMMAVPGLGWSQQVDTFLWAHGTTPYRFDVPTNLDPDVTYEGIPTVLALAAGYDTTNVRGDIVLYPGGTGFGESSIPRHRYFDRFSQVATMIDLYVAVEYALPTFAVDRSDKLFLGGFSQGGNVAPLTALELQANGTPVSGVIAIAGPLDLEEITVDYIAQIPDPGAMLLMAYLTQAAYDTGRLPGWSLEEIFLDPATYDAFDMTLQYGQVLELMPFDLASTFTVEFIDEQVNTPWSAFRDWLDESNVIADQCPNFPVVVTNAVEDVTVPVEMAEAWVNSWSVRCPASDIVLNVTSASNNPYLGHDQSWINELVPLGAQANAL